MVLVSASPNLIRWSKDLSLARPPYFRLRSYGQLRMSWRTGLVRVTALKGRPEARRRLA
jgi:hypothetical protein